jgi:hypothetical protein
MSSRLEILKVDKFEADWSPEVLFQGYTIRAVLTKTNDLITRTTERSRLAKRLNREEGIEGEDWILANHPHNGEVELYLRGSGRLIMWKLQDHESFSNLFDRVEQHVDNINEIREQNN